MLFCNQQLSTYVLDFAEKGKTEALRSLSRYVPGLYDRKPKKLMTRRKYDLVFF